MEPHHKEHETIMWTWDFYTLGLTWVGLCFYFHGRMMWTWVFYIYKKAKSVGHALLPFAIGPRSRFKTFVIMEGVVSNCCDGILLKFSFTLSPNYVHGWMVLFGWRSACKNYENNGVWYYWIVWVNSCCNSKLIYIVSITECNCSRSLKITTDEVE
jgi:hypothetical protein